MAVKIREGCIDLVRRGWLASSNEIHIVQNEGFLFTNYGIDGNLPPKETECIFEKIIEFYK